MALTKVSTDGVKNDAIDASKLPANSVGASELADDAVDNEHLAANSVRTEQIQNSKVTLAKLPLGTSSQDGKFLRANNGGQPTFESIPAGTTINNNADNRVITGSGTANTLNGESGLTYDSTTLVVSGSGEVKALNNTANNTDKQAFFTTGHYDTAEENVLGLRVVGGDADNIVDIGGGSGQSSYNSATKIRFFTGANDTTLTGTERMRINPNGNVGIGTTNPQTNLHLQVSGTDAPIAQFSSASYTGYVATAHADNNIGNGSKAGNLVLRGQTGVAIMGNNGTTTQVKVDSDGLKFNNDTAAANALNDYEEGDWTPAIDTGSGSITVYSAKYTKIGNQVALQFYIGFNNTSGNSNQVNLSGIPFTPTSSGWVAAKLATGYSNSAIHCRINPSTAKLDFKIIGDGGVSYATMNGWWALSSIVYFTDS